MNGYHPTLTATSMKHPLLKWAHLLISSCLTPYEQSVAVPTLVG